MNQQNLSFLSGEPYEEKEHPYKQINDLIKDLVDNNFDGRLSEITSQGELAKHSFQEIYFRSQVLATHLLNCGIRQHDKVVVLYDTAHEFIAAIWACFKQGIVAVPWSFQGVEIDREKYLSSFYELVEELNNPYILFSSTSNNRLNVSEICKQNKQVDTAILPDYTSLACNVNSAPTAIALMVATSGTTGKPKLAKISYSALIHRKLVLGNPTQVKDIRTLTIVPLNSITAQTTLAFPSHKRI